MMWDCCFWVGENALAKANSDGSLCDSCFDTNDNFEFQLFFQSYILSVLETYGQDTKIVYIVKKNGICYGNPTIVDIHGPHKWIYKK